MDIERLEREARRLNLRLVDPANQGPSSVMCNDTLFIVCPDVDLSWAWDGETVWIRCRSAASGTGTSITTPYDLSADEDMDRVRMCLALILRSPGVVEIRAAVKEAINMAMGEGDS